ncbi:MAG TPA: universal stress protein [Thermoleophilaceae bacterium]|nr:universal stress protein [Thermoleophilaceae bacterium]
MFSKIVVGTDGSDTADRAVTRAADLARLSGASLHVVSAYAGSPVKVAGGAGPEAAEWAVGADYRADAVLQNTLARLRADGIDLHQHAPKGDPADGILEVARREEADLIVLGSKGMQGARRVLGSVPNKVSHHAPCDLLIVNTA